MEVKKEEFVTWKTCRTCGEPKELKDFPLSHNFKVLASGKKKHYKPKRKDICKLCTHGPDRYRKLVEACNKKLHPYL